MHVCVYVLYRPLPLLLCTGLAACVCVLVRRVRHAVLDVLHRLPLTDALEAYYISATNSDSSTTSASTLLPTVLQCFTADNEDNALLALKVITELLKLQRSLPIEV